MEKLVEKTFGNRVRVRVCGICMVEDKLVLLQHKGVGEKGVLWAPPGGGVEYGEGVKESLAREFLEEVGVTVLVEDFLFLNEFLHEPLHAIELFFKVSIIEGELTMGTDPELGKGTQLISELKLWSFDEILKEDPLLFHEVLRGKQNREDFYAQKDHFQD